MNKSYLLVFSGNSSEMKDEIKETLNKMKLIKTWRTDMSNCFYIISEGTAQELYKEFESIRGKKGRFLFVEASPNRQGLLTPDTWYFLQNKKHKPKENTE